MTIPELYLRFQEQVERKEIHLLDRSNNSGLVLDFRNTYGVHLKEEDELFLLALLVEEKWKCEMVLKIRTRNLLNFVSNG